MAQQMAQQTQDDAEVALSEDSSMLKRDGRLCRVASGRSIFACSALALRVWLVVDLSLSFLFSLL